MHLLYFFVMIFRCRRKVALHDIQWIHFTRKEYLVFEFGQILKIAFEFIIGGLVFRFEYSIIQKIVSGHESIISRMVAAIFPKRHWLQITFIFIQIVHLFEMAH